MLAFYERHDVAHPQLRSVAHLHLLLRPSGTGLLFTLIAPPLKGSFFPLKLSLLPNLLIYFN